MTDNNTEQALVEARKELLEVSAAEAALENTAIMSYFEQVKEQALQAMLNPQLDADEKTLWRIRATAQVVFKLFSYLEEKRDMRRYIEDQIKSLEG